MVQCSLHCERSYFVHFTSSPLFIVPKVSLSLNPKKCALSWKIPERSSTFGAGLDLCLIAEFSNKPVWPFAPLPPPTSCQTLGTFEKFPESLSAKSARFQPIAALLGFRRAGHVPPSPVFRPSALSFVLESQLIGLRPCFSV